MVNILTKVIFSEICFDKIKKKEILCLSISNYFVITHTTHISA